MTILGTGEDGSTAIEMVRGDSEELLLTVTDDAGAALDLSQAVDGTPSRAAVLRFAVKLAPADESNDDALIFKTSHDDSEIQILAQTGATLGQARVLIDKPDTEAAEETEFSWDLEVTWQDAIRTAASVGTVSVEADSFSLVGVGTKFTKAKVGDVLQLLGTNHQAVIVEDITDDEHITVSFSGFVDESGISFEAHRGRCKTVARGPFTLLSGVVSQ